MGLVRESNFLHHHRPRFRIFSTEELAESPSPCLARYMPYPHRPPLRALLSGAPAPQRRGHHVPPARRKSFSGAKSPSPCRSGGSTLLLAFGGCTCIHREPLPSRSPCRAKSSELRGPPPDCVRPGSSGSPIAPYGRIVLATNLTSFLFAKCTL